jgi:hypothetical protein
MSELYDRYHNYVKSILNTNDLTNFKNNINYTYMLEHVSFKEGIEYLYHINKKFNLNFDEIKSFCDKNDTIGNPTKFDYPFGKASPTSLRYILHALLILEYISNLKQSQLNLVELGGGYGGLCLCIYHFKNKFDLNLNFTYTIIDLKYVNLLQKEYLKLHDLEINCLEPYGETFNGKNNFLISNYCFAEIDKISQEKYINILFPKIDYGFITWNEFTDPYDFGFDCTIIDEYPQTGVKNKYVYFKKK